MSSGRIQLCLGQASQKPVDMFNSFNMKAKMKMITFHTHNAHVEPTLYDHAHVHLIHKYCTFCQLHGTNIWYMWWFHSTSKTSTNHLMSELRQFYLYTVVYAAVFYLSSILCSAKLQHFKALLHGKTKVLTMTSG